MPAVLGLVDLVDQVLNDERADWACGDCGRLGVGDTWRQHGTCPTGTIHDLTSAAGRREWRRVSW